MNRFVTSLGIVGVGILVAAGSVGAEILENPSFEIQGAQSDRAAGWDRWGDWMNRETGWTPTRDGSCLMSYHHWQIKGENNSGLYQDLKGIQPGKMYTFSIYANVDPAKQGEEMADSVEVRLETTLYGEQSTVASRKYRVKDLADGQNWSLIRLRTRVPNDVLRVVIVVTPSKNGSRGGAIKFDDAQLTAE
jgi:hypothetical protein